MADGRITLIDVMRGVRKHGLIDRMSEECFTFLIGIILEANELGFKNPIGLTVSQALPVGGGHNRQTLNGRRKSLAKVKIDGKQLVKIKAGNKGQNSVATYEIDYNLLCSQNGAWQGLETPPSNKLDNSPSIHTTSQPHVNTQPAYHPKIRSEEKREENPPNPPNDVTTSDEPENEKEEGGVAPLDQDEDLDRTVQKVKYIQELILRKWKHQLKKAPDIGAVKDALREFNGDHKGIVMAITKATRDLHTATPTAALNLVLKIARNEGGDNGGISQEQISEREREIQGYEAGLATATQAGDEAAISQLSYLIEQKKESLIRLQQE